MTVSDSFRAIWNQPLGLRFNCTYEQYVNYEWVCDRINGVFYAKVSVGA